MAHDHAGLRKVIPETEPFLGVVLPGIKHDQFDDRQDGNDEGNVADGTGLPIIGQRLAFAGDRSQADGLLAEALSIEEWEGVASEHVAHLESPSQLAQHVG